MVNIIIIPFLVLCTYKIKFNKSGFYSDNLSKDNFLAMKGLLAISIILCHLSEMPGVDDFYFFRGTGNLGVSIFLFLSGYGLLCSTKKSGTTEGFVKKRISSVFIPFIVVELVYLVFSYFVPEIYGMSAENYSPLTLIKNFITSGSTLIVKGWYVFEIILLYIEFFIAFKITKTNIRKGLRLMLFFVILTTLFFAILTYKTGWIQFWAYSTLAFAYGLIWAQYKEYLDAFFQKHYYFYLSVFLIATIVFFYSNKIFDRISFFKTGIINTTFFSRYLTSPFFVFLVVLITMKFKGENRILNFLGEISYELYLIHGMIYCLLRCDKFAFVTNDTLYVFFTLAISIDIGFILHEFNKTIRKLYLKQGE